MLHVKEFKMSLLTVDAIGSAFNRDGARHDRLSPIFEAAKKANIEHAFVEQEEFDMPLMEALKIDADYMRAIAG